MGLPSLKCKYLWQLLYLNKVLPTDPIMLNRLCVSNDSGNFTVVSSVHFMVLYVATMYIYIYIYIYIMTAQRVHVA